MSTKVSGQVNARVGELVNLMRTRLRPHGNVSEVRGELRGKLTNTAYALVDVTMPGALYMNVWCIRDDIGYLHEVSEPCCMNCEETIECACMETRV